MTTAFVADATGYTGRSVVPTLRARGIEAVAHVRPDSRSLAHWRTVFTSQGASVDTSPWSPQGIAGAMASHRPDFVFALIGTTAKRGKVDGSTYESVDYGLTVMLLEAAAAMEPRHCFVYLSVAGAGSLAWGAY
ncbi:MAG: NAD-dependent epimerase/dehydratase family protein, partial [Gemmatimonadota bacterium]